MEVLDKRSSTGYDVGVEGNSNKLPLCWGNRVIIGSEQEPPEFGASGIVVSSEEDGIVFGEHHGGHLFEE